MNKLKPVVFTSATTQIADQVRTAIFDGTFKSGEQLPTEMEMAQQFGVSRPTIREALKRLAAQNLIVSRRGPAGGTFVRQYDVEDAAETVVSATMLMLSLESVKYFEILDVRRSLEIHCCNQVIDSWDAGKGHQIDEALHHLADVGLHDDAFCDADVAFHRAIVEATENPMLRFLMYGVIEALMPVMSVNIAYVHNKSLIVELNRAIRDRLFERDKEGVGSAIDDLMSYLRKLSERADAHPIDRT